MCSLGIVRSFFTLIFFTSLSSSAFSSHSETSGYSSCEDDSPRLAVSSQTATPLTSASVSPFSLCHSTPTSVDMSSSPFLKTLHLSTPIFPSLNEGSKRPTTFSLDRSIFNSAENKTSEPIIKENFYSTLPTLKGFTEAESKATYQILVERVEVSLQNKKGDALLQGLALRIRDLTTGSAFLGMTILSRLQNIDAWCSKTVDHHWSVYRHACRLLDIAVQNDRDLNQSFSDIASAVAVHYEVFASILDSLLHKFDELVVEQKENEESVEQYKAVLKVFSALTHETPDLLEGAFDKKTLPEFLEHIGTQTLKDKEGLKQSINLFFCISRSFIDLPSPQTGIQLSRKFQDDTAPILAKYRDITTKKYPYGRCCP